VLRFELAPDGPNLIDLTLLEQRTATGDTVRIQSQFQLLGG
jgi:hypothetical protein